MKLAEKIFRNNKYYVTSPYGSRGTIKTSAGNTSSFHNGTDYGTKGENWPQYAVEDGYVFAATKASDGALYVWVIYPRIKKALLHYHLQSYSVKAGQTVKEGTKLGLTGRTGKATGVHLHLGVRDLSKLTAAQIKAMTWDLLRSCSYIDPEGYNYTEKKTTTTNQKTTTTVNRKTAKAGASVKLEAEPLYASSTATKRSALKTGTFYFLDNSVVNNRRRITNNKSNVGKSPASLYTTGWINV